MNITLESIKAEQTKIAAMIAAFEQQPGFPVTVPFPSLNAGERAVGVIISADGTRRYWLILLPHELEPARRDVAEEWAHVNGGELPDRVEGALLFATMKAEFKEAWYWTREQHASTSDYAWCQHFNNGNQDIRGKSAELRARAVRRLKI